MRSAVADASVGDASTAARASAGFSCVSSAMVSLLHDHFFEEHVFDLEGCSRHIDAAQKLFLQADHAGGAFAVIDAQLAQITLKLIDDARHQRANASFLVRAGQFERHGEL